MPSPNLHVVYRSAESPGKNRPPFFSKEVALLSFLRAVRACGEPIAVTFLNDGPIDQARGALMETAGETVKLDGIGNSQSYRQALALVERLGLQDEDLVYLAEDDFLYLPEAFSELLAAAREIPAASYFSLYEPPIDYYGNDDADIGRTRLFVAGDRHWRTAESTTMTFGARLGALRRDGWIHWLGTQKAFPDDRRIWLATQGLKRFRLARALGAVDLVPRDGLVVRHLAKRFLNRPAAGATLLVSPMPTLATHAEEGVLAPLVDWVSVAEEAQAWGRVNNPLPS